MDLMHYVLPMVIADSQDSHDDACVDDKSQHFVSIGSLKQHDAGQMHLQVRSMDADAFDDCTRRMDEQRVVMTVVVVVVGGRLAMAGMNFVLATYAVLRMLDVVQQQRRRQHGKSDVMDSCWYRLTLLRS